MTDRSYSGADLAPLDRLVYIVDRLLGPGGCPWDQAQTHESLKKYLLEEAYEVLEAIDREDPAGLAEELGDLLLQPILHAQISAKNGGFSTREVATAICDKLVRRHPHVFGDVEAEDADAVLKNWDQIKRSEKGDESPASILDGVPRTMPSLARALMISKRAARAGFEWPDIEAVFEKLREEEREFAEALAGGDPERIESEMGDWLFTMVNVARWTQVDPEESLRRMLDRFTARFQWMEQHADGNLADLDATSWDNLWNRAKSASS